MTPLGTSNTHKHTYTQSEESYQPNGKVKVLLGLTDAKQTQRDRQDKTRERWDTHRTFTHIYSHTQPGEVIKAVYCAHNHPCRPHLTHSLTHTPEFTDLH